MKRSEKREQKEARPTQSANGGFDPGKIKKKKKNTSFGWAIKVLFATFFLSFAISFISEITVGNSGVAVAVIIVLAIIVVNILFDVIGTAAASCNIQPFLSMASRKIKGAKCAVRLVQNAEKVSSICADVIGDICGIVSGAAGAAISLKLFAEEGWTGLLGGIIISSVIAALTVGGKAFGKKFAIDNNQKIIFIVAKLFTLFGKK